MEENLNTPPVSKMDEIVVIDWMGVVSKILGHWKQIVLIGFLFGCAGIASALLMKREYNATMTLAPELQGQSSSGISSITNMLGLGGTNVGGSDAVNISLFPEISQSTPFLVALLDVPLSSCVSQEQKEAGVQPLRTTVYKHLSGEDKPNYKPKEGEKPYTGIIDPTEMSFREAAVVGRLARSIGVDVDSDSGMTTVSVTLDDPMMAKQLADTVCRRLQVYVSNYRTQKALDDYNYYVLLAEEAHEELVRAQAAYARSVDYDRSVILQEGTAEKERLREEASLASQIYSQMAQQRELARAKIQEQKPVYVVVQPASLPLKPTKSRAKHVIMWGFAGVFLAVAWYGLLKDFFRKFRSDVKEKMS